MDYNTPMRILNIFLITWLLVACSDQDDQIKNSIKLKDVDAGDDLQLLRKDFQERVFNPHPDVYVVVGYGLANSILIKGEDEDLIIDTMGGIETAERIIQEFEKVSSNTKKVIAYTHFHADHILGAQAFTEKYDVNKSVAFSSWYVNKSLFRKVWKI